MAWKVSNVSEVRFALCHCVRSLGVPVARAARDFGVSRKTAHKWLTRFDRLPEVQAMLDRSRRPRVSPRRVDDAVEARVLAVRDAHGWGPRKVHAVMRRTARDDPASALALSPLPCLRTVANVLKRNGRLAPPTPTEPPAVGRFERAVPNELWQLDHKGPVEVERRAWMPLTVIDDHSRYLLAFKPMPDKTLAAAFAALWDLMGEVGMPESILADNAFGALSSAVGGLGWFDTQLVKLGIRPIHGRPRHPQTQGKAEALHHSAVRELIARHARRDRVEHFVEDCEAWRVIYNTQRPHESLGDEVPLSRWRPSERPRPATLPSIEYDAGVTTRQAFAPGLITWRGVRIRVGAGLIGERVSIQENGDHETEIRYGFKRVRRLRPEQLVRDRVV